MKIQPNSNDSFQSPSSQNNTSQNNASLTPNEANIQAFTPLEIALSSRETDSENKLTDESADVFPENTFQAIEDEISYNAPIRSISVLIPIDSVKFGRDCIELHNDIIRKLLSDPDMKLGDRIAGTPGSTHQILYDKGLAGPLRIFDFVTKSENPTKVNSTAHHLKDSVGYYIVENSGKTGVSVYGVSALDGYHSMIVAYRVKDGAPDFMLVDQGPATSFVTGKSAFTSAENLDKALSEYVRDKQDKRTQGGYEYPANIQIYQIYRDTN